jgi:hypothetical protein
MAASCRDRHVGGRTAPQLAISVPAAKATPLPGSTQQTSPPTRRNGVDQLSGPGPAHLLSPLAVPGMALVCYTAARAP